MKARSFAILNNCEIFTLNYTSLYKHESKEKERVLISISRKLHIANMLFYESAVRFMIASLLESISH